MKNRCTGRPGRKHIERLHVDVNPADIKLGTFLDNTRRRANKLTPNDAPSWTNSACAGSRLGHRGRRPVMSRSTIVVT
ncbi:hypothetical protein [Streptomyces olivaceoviridis]|uniref:hypothetical protein n=1 Tax=Streptomyces olivaceoviridis TaxID=1921 RepID=UPI0037B41767